MDWGLTLVSKILQDGSLAEYQKMGLTPDDLPGDSAPLLRTILEFARRNGNQVPSPAFLREKFATFDPDPEVSEGYAELSELIRGARKRFLIDRALQQAADLRNASKLDEALVRLRQALSEVDTLGSSTVWADFSQSVDQLRSTYLARKEMGPVHGIPSGLPWLDDHTRGWRPGQLISIVAPWKMGKTWLAVVFAYNAWSRGHVPLMISNEMQASEFLDRLAALHARVPYGDYLKAQLTNDEEDRFFSALDTLKDSLPLIVLEPGLQPDVTWVEAMVEQYGPDLLVLDGLYLMEDARGGRERYAFYNLTRDAKRLAARKKIPAIITSQMTNPRQWKGKAKQTEGGSSEDAAFGVSIMQDSDVFLVLHRTEEQIDVHEATIKLAEIREGQQGVKRTVRWDFRTMTFGEPVNTPEEQELDDFQRDHARDLIDRPGVKY